VRILLDNCVPVRLAASLKAYNVMTALEMGWDRKPDPVLLELMKGKFDVLITVDRNIAKQNRIEGREFAVIVLRAKSNQIKHLLQVLPQLKAALNQAVPGAVIEVTL
jgi:predicted nuclease of predicted toxin-antitoxin system